LAISKQTTDTIGNLSSNNMENPASDNSGMVQGEENGGNVPMQINDNNNEQPVDISKNQGPTDVAVEGNKPPSQINGEGGGIAGIQQNEPDVTAAGVTGDSSEVKGEQGEESMKALDSPVEQEVQPSEANDAEGPPIKKQKMDDVDVVIMPMEVEDPSSAPDAEQKDTPTIVEGAELSIVPATEKVDQMEVNSTDKIDETPAATSDNGASIEATEEGKPAESGPQTEESTNFIQETGDSSARKEESAGATADEANVNLEDSAPNAEVVDEADDSKLNENTKPSDQCASGPANGEDLAEEAPNPMSAPVNGEKVDGKMKFAEVRTPKVVTEMFIADGDETSGETKTPKHIRSKNVDPKILELRRRIQGACRDNDLEIAMTAYDEAVRDNTRIEAQSFYNLLNLCDGLERSVHVGTPKSDEDTDTLSKNSPVRDGSIDNKKRQDYAFLLKDHMMRLSLPLNETAYSAIVKVLVRNKEYAKAEEMIDESEPVEQCRPKLRLFASLLTAYCDDRQMVDALKCWLRISKTNLELTEREYLSLMKCATATGDVHVFDRVLSDIAETVAVPSKDTVSRILDWYESPHGTIHLDPPIRIPKHADESQVKLLLEEIHQDEVERPPSMGPVQTGKGWDVSSAVPIDTQTGTLKEGILQGCTLQPVPLSSRAWEEMMTMNETIVLEGQVEGNKSQFQGGRKGKMRNQFNPQERKDKWKHFNDFLESMGSIDVVIDSANVGYFKQNFANAPKHVDYDQIDWVARRFLEMGKKVLLILHQRHFSPTLMPATYKPLQEAWENMGILYKTPPGMNDDWFWLHAALKYKTQVLTNDEMRDHHFQMLAPRTFLRWKERHQVHFSFGDWGNRPSQEDDDDGATGRKRQVELNFPPVYSRRVQRIEDGLVVPLIKRGDENRFLDGKHVAEADEPEEETYLCFRAMQQQ
jgi:hypothetical protein